MAASGNRAGILRGLLLALGLLVTGNAGWLAVTANLNAGTAMAAGLGILLIGWSAWLPRLRGLRAVNLVAGPLFAAMVVVSSLLATVGTADNARYDEDAVIVLGAAVHGDQLSSTLVGRLDRAVAYHLRNPDALVVVSGGRGPQEDLAEGVAMRRYLLDRGVPQASILLEDRAASTEENFRFSKALLDARMPAGYRVVFVTDEFHVYRAGRIASAVGLDAAHLSSRTPWYFWQCNYLREDLLVVALWATKGIAA